MGIDLMLRGRLRPGWIRRGRVDLSSLASWLRQECGSELESLDHDTSRDGEPRLLAWLHPAAESVELVALPEGEIEISARTTPTGPGYHFYLTRLLKKLGEDLRIDWLPPVEEEDADASYDDTGFFFGAGAGEVYLQMDRWLATIAQLILERAEDGDSSFSLGMPLQTGFTQLDFANTPLGPRSRDWITQVAAEVLEGDSRTASDFFPWPREGQDGDYWFRRALVLLWTQAVWRPAEGEREEQLAKRIDQALERAWILDPSLAAANGQWPWREWLELRSLAGIHNHLDGQIAAQALLIPVDRPRLGYRRHEVIHRLMAGWSVRLPGSFSVQTEGDRWRAQDRERSVNVTLFESAHEEFAFPGNDIAWTYVDESPHQSGRAYVREPVASGGEFHLHGLVSVPGQFATITITFGDAVETDWALTAWRSLRFLPARELPG